MLTKKDPSPIRATAALALANDPDPSSGTALTRAVKDKNWMVRVAALRAIAMHGDSESLDAVAAAMQDRKDEVRFAAAVALLKLTAEIK
jgi:HEAT repeat protein